MQRFARQEAARLLRAQEQGACPVCPRGRLGPAREAVALGLREAVLPQCGACAPVRRRRRGGAVHASTTGPVYTRGSTTERVAGLAIAKGGGGQHADPTRSSLTVYELRKDGARNECDYRVWLDERYKSQPYVMEKVPCVADGQEMLILGRAYQIHLPDAPRYRPDVV